MKKILLLFSFILVAAWSYAQLDKVDNGSAPGAGDGEILYTAFEKVNAAIYAVDTLELNQIDSSGVVSIVTNTQFDSLFTANLTVTDTTILGDQVKIGDVWYNNDNIQLVDSVQSISRTIYISEYPVGNDTTGDGTSGNPWHSIIYALENTPQIIEGSTVTYQIDTGNYNFSGTEAALYAGKLIRGASTVQMLGTFETIQSSISISQDADTLFRWNATGQTWTPGEFVNHFALLAGEYYPIYDNGVDWLIVPYSGSWSSANIYKPMSNLNLPASDLTFQPYIGEKVINFYRLIINTANKLNIASGSPYGTLNFSEMIINCEQITYGKISAKRNNYNCANKGVIIQRDGANIQNSNIKGTGSNYCIQVQNGSYASFSDLIIDDFTKGFDQGVSFSNIKTSREWMFFNVPLAFELDEGSYIFDAPTIHIRDVDHLYTSIVDKNTTAIFDTNLIYGHPNTAWILNDNGIRYDGPNNYSVYIKGIHDPIQDTAYTNAIKTSQIEAIDTTLAIKSSIYTEVDTLGTSGSLTIDCNNSNTFVCYQAGDITALDVENLSPGATYVAYFYQGVTGGYSITLSLTPNDYEASGSEDFSTTADDINVFQFHSPNGTDIIYSNAVFTKQ